MATATKRDFFCILGRFFLGVPPALCAGVGLSAHHTLRGKAAQGVVPLLSLTHTNSIQKFSLMPSFSLRFFCLFSLLFLLCTATQAQIKVPAAPVPALLVADFANVLQANERAALELKLGKFEDAGNAQIVVVLVSSLQGEAIEDYAAALFKSWGIGDKARNDGVLLLLAMEDRKMRIETGYGAEDRITDALAARIIRTDLSPRLKENQTYLALHEATNSLIRKLNPNYTIPQDSLANAQETAQLALLQAKEAEEAANKARAEEEAAADFRLGLIAISVMIGLPLLFVLYTFFNTLRRQRQAQILEIFSLADNLIASIRALKSAKIYQDSADAREFADGFAAELGEYRQAAEGRQKNAIERLRALCSQRWQQVEAYTVLSRVYAMCIADASYPKEDFFAAEVQRFRARYRPQLLALAPMSIIIQNEKQDWLKSIEKERPVLRFSAQLRPYFLLAASRHEALAQNIAQCLINPLMLLEQDGEFLALLEQTPQNEMLNLPAYAPLKSFMEYLHAVLGQLRNLIQALERFNTEANPQTFVKKEKLQDLQREACGQIDSLLSPIYMQFVRTRQDFLQQAKACEAETTKAALLAFAYPLLAPSVAYLTEAMQQYGDLDYLKRVYSSALGTEKLSQALRDDAMALRASFRADANMLATVFENIADTVYSALIGSVYTSKYLNFLSSTTTYTGSSSSSSSYTSSRSYSRSSSSSYRSSSSSSSSSSSFSSSRSYGGGSSGGGGASGSW